MPVSMYVPISLIGVLTCHYISERYRKNNKTLVFILYVSAICAFGEQHYGILFEKSTVANWLFIIPTQTESASDSMRLMAFAFLVMTVATLPPSKFSNLTNYIKAVARR